MKVEYAARLDRIPRYIFAELDVLKQEQKRKGTDIISLAIGDPDIHTPRFILDALAKEAADPKNHNYPSYAGEGFYREEVGAWMQRRFGAEVNPENEALATIGSKEAIANMGRAFVDSGDTVLCPDPGYPVYANGTTILSDANAVKMPLLEQNNFLPDFEAIKKEDAKKASLMFLNTRTTLLALFATGNSWRRRSGSAGSTE
ncbi:LL-diaminopimelate aminotransferase [uncultured archaeon]|nr:LL-diaminopimelate aminotransferase [uncultured archaeon]